MDRIELPPCVDSFGGTYELEFDGRILTVTTRWEKKHTTLKFDVGLAKWSLKEQTTMFKRRQVLWFSINTPGTDGSGQVSAEGFDADVLREFVERVFDARSGIPASSILGRAAVMDVRKEVAGEMVDCAVTAKVRLVDGTPVYQATFHECVIQSRADQLQAGRTIAAVRVGLEDHSEVSISWSETVPVVTVTDPDILEPPARALRDGQPCRIVVLDHWRQSLKTPAGEELYAATVRVTSDGSEVQVMLHVPASEIALLVDGNELPATRLELQPNVIAVDWGAALSEAPSLSPIASQSGTASTDPIVRLQQLANLHDRGVLTDAEFATEKAKILSAN